MGDEKSGVHYLRSLGARAGYEACVVLTLLRVRDGILGLAVVLLVMMLVVRVRGRQSAAENGCGDQSGPCKASSRSASQHVECVDDVSAVVGGKIEVGSDTTWPTRSLTWAGLNWHLSTTYLSPARPPTACSHSPSESRRPSCCALVNIYAASHGGGLVAMPRS